MTSSSARCRAARAAAPRLHTPMAAPPESCQDQATSHRAATWLSPARPHRCPASHSGDHRAGIIPERALHWCLQCHGALHRPQSHPTLPLHLSRHAVSAGLHHHLLRVLLLRAYCCCASCCICLLITRHHLLVFAATFTTCAAYSAAYSPLASAAMDYQPAAAEVAADLHSPAPAQRLAWSKAPVAFFHRAQTDRFQLRGLGCGQRRLGGSGIDTVLLACP